MSAPIFTAADKDGDVFSVEESEGVDGLILVDVNHTGAYLTAEQVDELREALIPYGTNPSAARLDSGRVKAAEKAAEILRAGRTALTVAPRGDEVARLAEFLVGE